MQFNSLNHLNWMCVCVHNQAASHECYDINQSISWSSASKIIIRKIQEKTAPYNEKQTQKSKPKQTIKIPEHNAYLSLYLLAYSSDGNGDVAKFSGNSSASVSRHSWTKNASPLSPNFICMLTGSPLTSISTCFFNVKVIINHYTTNLTKTYSILT